MQLSTKQIMEIIPHRQPFLLLDTIEELEPGVRAVGKKCVTYNEPFFAGHFPQEPVMPGVLILEALAQAGAVAISASRKTRENWCFSEGLTEPVSRGKWFRGMCSYWKHKSSKLRAR